MKIELYLAKVNHDHSVLTDDGFAEVGWIHGMAKPEMATAAPILQISKSPAAGERLPHIAIRREDWGGFLVHGPSASVYKLDLSAIAIFERLKGGELIEEIRSNPGPLTPREVADFEKTVRDLNLI
ncbi:hypothetical protein ACSFBF_10245 [Variovorax sp. ZT5P49]|uniref:hypothetical protein n=1 Tax=Variovorax sp. ZT5P49 TaxID=3443733 RepID=UPI003F4827A4